LSRGIGELVSRRSKARGFEPISRTLFLLAVTALAGTVLLMRRSAPTSPWRNAPPLQDPEPESPSDIGFSQLLEELVDLSSVARLPDPPYVAKMASSFDRRSLSRQDPEAWFANEDWASQAQGNFVRVDEHDGLREYVLLDVDGPGALVRIWTATPTGTLRIFLDHQPRPSLEAPMVDLLGGHDLVPKPFAHVAARGYTAYFPIPFRKACRVTVDDLVASDPFGPGPLEKFYYQINYRLYPSESTPRVRTFHPKDVARAASTLAEVGKVLEHPSSAADPSSNATRISLVETGGEAEATVTTPSGGTIRKLSLRIRDMSEVALRRATITLTMDGEVTAQVPLGDFFGTGPGLSAYESLPFSVAESGICVCRWPMPFQKSATLVVKQSPGIEGELWVEPAPWTERSLHFHATWRPEAVTATRPLRDLRMSKLRGSGLYVGTMFNLTNPPGARWWGEGDEKMRVDGERFPSIFGTGTEDYFGYAWSTAERFNHALHAQTRAGVGGFDGAFSMNRFHTLDAVPFSKEFEFDLELWHWEDTRVSWSAMVYYYARPGTKEVE
jgi:hypothetical protein